MKGFLRRAATAEATDSDTGRTNTTASSDSWRGNRWFRRRRRSKETVGKMKMTTRSSIPRLYDSPEAIEARRVDEAEQWHQERGAAITLQEAWRERRARKQLEQSMCRVQ